MEVIVSHVNLDFDGLASMVAARKLFPHAVIVLPDKLSLGVKKFVALYKDSLRLEFPPSPVGFQPDRVVVVDANAPERLGEVARQWVQEEGVKVYVYDHHLPAKEEIRADRRLVLPVGSTTAILVEELARRSLFLSGLEATLMALGIYEDTGHLTFSNTTALDARSVAFLLEKGANLAVMSDFLGRPLLPEQQKLFQELMSSGQELRLGGLCVVVAGASRERYVPELSLITEKLLDVSGAEAVFSVVESKKKAYLVGRSRVDEVNVAQVLGAFGGGGHPRAASAVVSGKTLATILEEVQEEVRRTFRPVMVVREIMSRPVRTVTPETSVSEASSVLMRYGHSGLPVEKDGRLLGVISRRDLEKAMRHGLGHAPVKAYMTRELITVSPEASVSEVKEIMIDHDIGRVPVIDSGRLVGIVTRSDVLRVWHPEESPRLYYRKGNVAELLAERLPEELSSVVVRIGHTADRSPYRAYLVGGFVRDLLLGRASPDIDVVVEGDGMSLASTFASEMGGEVSFCPRFRTATVLLPGGINVDFGSARKEFYSRPARAPSVEAGGLREDLGRRDFTINALAVSINSADYGEVIDYFSGYEHLDKGLLKVLYSLSFVEDPVRILRGARFEVRYNFAMDPWTLELAQDPAARSSLKRVPGGRLWEEVKLIFAEREPAKCLARLVELGVWECIFPEVEPRRRLFLALARLSARLAAGGIGGDRNGAYLRCIYHGYPESAVRDALDRFKVKNTYQDERRLAEEIWAAIS